MNLLPVLRNWALALMLVIGSGGLDRARAQDQTPTPMQLGAVTHFDQGWPLSLLAGAQQIGVAGLRDELSWNRIEPRPGQYVFDDSRVTYLDTVGDAVPITIAFIYPNDNYDGGGTPYTDAGRAAFARFVVVTLDRFPNITRVEIGNEFNAQNFVFGPIREAPYAERAGYYVAILKAVYTAVKARHPHVEVLGGAAHSIPVGYFRQLFDLGALDYMDGIVIHPYTTEPEHLADHIGILNAAMGAEQVPIFATEFGREFDDPTAAAPYLVKMTTALAAAGVVAADWYALRQESYFRNMGLLDEAGTPMPAGKAFRLMQTLLQSSGTPQDVSPDAMTYAFGFGDHAMVLWGEPRTVALAPGVRALDATGQSMATEALMLDPGRPVVLLGHEALVLGETVVLGPQRVIADSFHQFDWTNEPDGPAAFQGPWSYFALRGDGDWEELYTLGGGDIQSEAWHPYIGHNWRRPLSVNDRGIQPVDFGGGTQPSLQYAVVEQFVSDRPMAVRITGRWAVAPSSEDGITLRIEQDGELLFTAGSRAPIEVDLPVRLDVGSTLNFIVGSNGNARGGDMTSRRIRIFASAE